jgi:hypothetical protein
MTFFCRADDIFEKSVEQSRFEQMHFEQLTLTQNAHYDSSLRGEKKESLIFFK